MKSDSVVNSKGSLKIKYFLSLGVCSNYYLILNNFIWTGIWQ